MKTRVYVASLFFTRNLHANKRLTLWCHQENVIRRSLKHFSFLLLCVRTNFAFTRRGRRKTNLSITHTGLCAQALCMMLVFVRKHLLCSSNRSSDTMSLFQVALYSQMCDNYNYNYLSFCLRQHLNDLRQCLHNEKINQLY